MTQAEFNKLPLLLMPGQAREMLNCDKATLRELRTAYPELAVRLKGRTHWRYRKAAVARIVGLRFE